MIFARVVSSRTLSAVTESRPAVFSAGVETWNLQHNVTPTMTGERLRLTYLLYEGAPPANPTVENSYRELHLWVNVTVPDS